MFEGEMAGAARSIAEKRKILTPCSKRLSFITSSAVFAKKRTKKRTIHFQYHFVKIA